MTAVAPLSPADELADDVRRAAVDACVARCIVIVRHERRGVGCVCTGRVVAVQEKHVLIALAASEVSVIPLSAVISIVCVPRKGPP
jgi:hypothetical protein